MSVCLSLENKLYVTRMDAWGLISDWYFYYNQIIVHECVGPINKQLINYKLLLFFSFTILSFTSCIDCNRWKRQLVICRSWVRNPLGRLQFFNFLEKSQSDIVHFQNFKTLIILWLWCFFYPYYHLKVSHIYHLNPQNSECIFSSIIL